MGSVLGRDICMLRDCVTALWQYEAVYISAFSTIKHAPYKFYSRIRIEERIMAICNKPGTLVNVVDRLDKPRSPKHLFSFDPKPTTAA